MAAPLIDESSRLIVIDPGARDLVYIGMAPRVIDDKEAIPKVDKRSKVIVTEPAARKFVFAGEVPQDDEKEGVGLVVTIINT